MFEVLIRHNRYGIMYTQCSQPCCEKSEDMVLACVSMYLNDKKEVGVCRAVNYEALVSLAEFLRGQVRNTSGTSHVPEI
jgi:hypothetical protein